MGTPTPPVSFTLMLFAGPPRPGRNQIWMGCLDPLGKTLPLNIYCSRFNLCRPIVRA
jgi:hypothetical protein